MRNKVINIFLAAVCVVGLTQCDEYFEANSDDILISDDYISNPNELYSGFMGVAAKVQSVADQAIFLSGLKSDFMVPTSSAPQDLWDIYNLNEQPDNEYTNPKGYYDVIVNANNYVNKAHEYNDKNPGAVNETIFNGLVSGAIRYKVWAYLQLGKVYDEVAFFDDNLVEFKDISGFRKLKISDGSLIDELLNQMLTGIALENGGSSINGQQPILWDAILYPDGATSGRDLTWSMICPEIDVLMTELYLWDENYKAVVDRGVNYLATVAMEDTEKKMVTNSDWKNEWMEFWTDDPVTITDELINIVPYDYARNQTNRLLDHFSNTGTGRHLLGPSQVSMDRWYAQVQDDGLTREDRYRGETRTFGMENGEWTVYKYTRSREAEIYKNNPHIILYRAADVHLWIAEALVQLEYFKEAEAFLNDGANAYFANFFGSYDYPFDDEVRNAAFVDNIGIRGRAGVYPVYPGGMTRPEALAVKEQIQNESTDDAVRAELIADYKWGMDSLVVEETLMESAAETRGHGAMVRSALRNNDNSILADRVSAKYPEGQRQSVRDMLMNDQSNWFIRFELAGIESE